MLREKEKLWLELIEKNDVVTCIRPKCLMVVTWKELEAHSINILEIKNTNIKQTSNSWCDAILKFLLSILICHDEINLQLGEEKCTLFFSVNNTEWYRRCTGIMVTINKPSIIFLGWEMCLINFTFHCTCLHIMLSLRTLSN